MNQSLYRGNCPVCTKHIRAGISLNANGLVPPPTITVGCGCSNPPIATALAYYGAHTEAREHFRHSVTWADKP